MHIIKLNATHSTNTYLRQLSDTTNLIDFTVVVTENQTSGRGQMGTNWESENGKNLTASVFVDVSFLKFDLQYYISMLSSLAIIKTLKQFSIPNLSIKWPNDILSDRKKICGILIENNVKLNRLQSTIIGVGLNVNQEDFKNLPQASSLKNITSVNYNVDELLFSLIEALQFYFQLLKQGKLHTIKKDYESLLYRKDKPSTFRDSQDNLFSGYIKSVTDSGKLNVLVEDNKVRAFDLKEITLLY